MLPELHRSPRMEGKLSSTLLLCNLSTLPVFKLSEEKRIVFLSSLWHLRLWGSPELLEAPQFRPTPPPWLQEVPAERIAPLLLQLLQPLLSRGLSRERISPPQRQLLRFTSIIRMMKSEPKARTPLYGEEGSRCGARSPILLLLLKEIP